MQGITLELEIVMKNKIVLCSILDLILVAVMLLTVTLRNIISSQLFDSAMISFGVLFLLIIVCCIVVIINHKSDTE